MTAAVLGIGVVAPGTSFASSTPMPASASDPAVVSVWNEIGVATLAGDTTAQPIEDILYMGFVQGAVYNAAQFFSGNPLVEYNAALRDQVGVRHLDIVDAARMQPS